MKIVYVSFEYPPLVLGGVGVYSYNLTRQLAGLGHEVHVVTTCPSGPLDDAPIQGLHLHRLKFTRRALMAMPSFWYSLRTRFPAIERQIGGFDIFHSEGVSDLCLGKRTVHRPRVLTVHHLASNTVKTLRPSVYQRIKGIGSEIGLTPLLESVCIKRADRLIAVSQYTRDSIITTHRVPKSRIDVIYHGINQEEYKFPEEEQRDFKAKMGFGSDPVVLFVGRLEERKGVDILLKAFSMVPRQTRARLVLAGSGDPSPYASQAGELGITDSVTFLGFVEARNLRLLYSTCDLFVLPSRLEGLGMAIQEAMAAGKPVVATRAGGMPEIVKSGENGLLVDPVNAGQLAEAMAALLQNADLRKSVGDRNSRAIREQFTWSRTARQTEQVYKGMLGQTND